MENDINLDEELTVPREVPESEMKIDMNYVTESGGCSFSLIPQWKPHSDFHNKYTEERCKEQAEWWNKQKMGIMWPGRNGQPPMIKWFDEPSETD
jgi:hypothetical protein